MEEFRSLLFLFSLGVFPFLTMYIFKKLKFSFLLSLVITFNVFGVIYLYFSTYHLISFRLDLLDILFIHLFHFSLFCWATIFKLKFSFFKLTHSIILNVIIGISICVLYINYYGPNEANGQYSPNQTTYQNNIKITNSLHTYGFMDSGSRILIRDISNPIFEKIIGRYEDAIYFYPTSTKFKILNSSHLIIEHYKDNELIIDTVIINKDMGFFANQL
jgi:hypothetical protein